VAEIVLGRLLHFLQDHRRNLGGRVALPGDLDGRDIVRPRDDLVRHALRLFLDLAHLAAHEPLDGKHRVGGVGDGLALGDLPDEALTVLGECHDGRSHPPTLGVRDDDRIATFHDRHYRVGRPQIDTDDLVSHCSLEKKGYPAP
jgi:hypothetical protein